MHPRFTLPLAILVLTPFFHCGMWLSTINVPTSVGAHADPPRIFWSWGNATPRKISTLRVDFREINAPPRKNAPPRLWGHLQYALFCLRFVRLLDSHIYTVYLISLPEQYVCVCI
jgi:hypothetical protein